MLRFERTGPYELYIPRQSEMLVDATVYASEAVNIEQTAMEQLAHGAALPTTQRAMATPDIHQGYGVPIGSVIATEEVICPAAVGYDINCGMRVLSTNLHVKDVDLEMMAGEARREIPLGEGKSNVRLSRADLDRVLAEGVAGLLSVKKRGHRVWDGWDDARERINLSRMEDNGSMQGNPAAVSDRAKQRGLDQLATLGGGNHFIEFQEVTDIRDAATAQRFGLQKGQLVVMIHSGSRGLGHQVGSEAMRQAQKLNAGAVPWLNLDSPEGKSYLGAMQAAANYAFANRHLMGVLVQMTIERLRPDARVNLLYDVPHNIAKLERHFGRSMVVHRKGATRAFGPKRMQGSGYGDTGQPVLIPGSMGTASYILKGIDGTEKSLSSVNHGAGRVMSRTQARGVRKKGKQVRPPAISDREFAEAMDGVLLISNSRHGVKEEAPQAYKDIDVVMDTVLGAGLAEAVARMRPVAVLKG